MTITQRIPAERLSDLDVREGDTLHILAASDSSFIVLINRADALMPPKGKVSEWLRTATGSVRLAAGETIDDARMEYYAAKYGVSVDGK